jgi:hypothetical protein
VHRNRILDGKENTNFVTVHFACRPEISEREERKRGEGKRDASAIRRKKRYTQHL